MRWTGGQLQVEYMLAQLSPVERKRVSSTSSLANVLSEGDVGGQKTLRSYWRNYFEKTDALIWVVDATDRARAEDCREELAGLLMEEVSLTIPSSRPPRFRAHANLVLSV